MANRGQLALLTARTPEPHGYGRIIRSEKDAVTAIIEERELSAPQRGIDEIFAGVLAARGGMLRQLLRRVNNDNAAGEYYQTDIIGIADAHCISVSAHIADHESTAGINTMAQLQQAERLYQRAQAEELMAGGVRLADADRIDIRSDTAEQAHGRVICGRDVVIDTGVIFIGTVRLAAGVDIGANCILRNSDIGAGSVILPNSIVDSAKIARDCRVGPFARIRPGTTLAAGSAIGNFVEVKNTALGEASKANHLSYLGDAKIGRRVNIGAGAITCNYDGKKKHRTTIRDDAFIGSNAALIAPIDVGARTLVAAGTALSCDLADDNLAVARVPTKQIARRDFDRKRRRTSKKR